MLISDAVNKPLIISCLALTFLCAPPLRADPADKPTCAVLNFDAKVGMSKDETEFLSERFATELGKLEKYQLISRSKMKEVFELQKFAFSDNCSATKCAILAGEILSAQFMVYGSIGKIGNTYSVNVALVNVESGAIASQASVDVKGAVDDLLSSGMLNAARQLTGLGMLVSTPAAMPTTVQVAGEAAPDQPLMVDLGAGVKMEFVWVGEGEFDMGSNDSDADSDEKPAHRVRISKGFWMGKHEVTQAQWEQVMGNNPSQFKGARNPVERVSWDDAQEFIKKLNTEHRTQNTEFRLPTEAEWEYAAKGGTLSNGRKYSGSDNIDAVAWYGSNSGGKTHPVGGKNANELGLHDMSGNVWEWCEDWYGAYDVGTDTDPVGSSSGSARVLRGGSWNSSPRICRSAARSWFDPSYTLDYDGFRVVVSSR